MNANVALKIVRNPLRRLPVLFLLSGMLAASLVFLRIEANREARVFESLKNLVDAGAGRNSSPEAKVIEAMHLTHAIMRNPSVLNSWITSNTDSKVLARLLHNYNYTLRIGRMKAKGSLGAHNVVEVLIDGRWMIADPLYDNVIRQADEDILYTQIPVLDVVDLYFYIALVAFILLNGYIYMGTRGSLPWQMAAHTANFHSGVVIEKKSFHRSRVSLN
jgi:hypothetical protein